MCEPATISLALGGLAIVTSAATGIVSYIGQSQQAAAQAQYQTQVAQARNQEIMDNAKLAQESYLRQAQQLNLRQQQEDEKAGQDIQQTQREAAQARATVRVAAGESGIAGLSVDNLLRDFYRQEDVFNESVRRNRDFSRLQSQQDMLGLQAEAQGRIASIRPYIPEPIVRPNLLGTALQIVGDVASRGSNMADQYKRYKDGW
jgi:hypothetical protein